MPFGYYLLTRASIIMQMEERKIIMFSYFAHEYFGVVPHLKTQGFLHLCSQELLLVGFENPTDARD